MLSKLKLSTTTTYNPRRRQYNLSRKAPSVCCNNGDVLSFIGLKEISGALKNNQIVIFAYSVGVSNKVHLERNNCNLMKEGMILQYV